MILKHRRENMHLKNVKFSTQIPKPGGVKRGWMRAYAVVCDFKVLLYETSGEKTPTNELIEVIDMK